MTALFGPQNANAATILPTGTNGQRYGGNQTWVRDCSAPGMNDGTILDAAFYNRIIGNLEYLTSISGINATPGDMSALHRAILAVISGTAPDLLNTLKELADAIGDDPHFISTMNAALDNRVRFDATQILTPVQIAKLKSNMRLSTVAFTGSYTDLINVPALAQAAKELSVNVKTDFNAVGDGVVNDWQAIENAGLYLAARGGGRMYFPPGRYSMPFIGQNLTVRSNIEYYGAGPSSVIVGSNAGFAGLNGARFGLGSYGSYNYYPANNVAAGDKTVTSTNPANAASFSAGDIIMISSTGHDATTGLKYFIEINRVLAVDASTGIINLEDPIEDGWALGLTIARITQDVSQNYSIHDLAVECETGHPLFLSASYKGEIRNVHTLGLSAFVANAFARSSVHHVNARVNWSGGITYSVIEIESGSVRGEAHDFDVSMYGTGDVNGHPLIYCQEFSRRSRVANVRINARGTQVGDLFGPSTAGGHTFENIELNAKGMGVLCRYSAADNTIFSQNSLGCNVRTVRCVLDGGAGTFLGGFTLNNDSAGGTVERVTAEDVEIVGVNTGGTLVWFSKGIQKDHLFRNVRGPGLIRMNAAGLTFPDIPDAGGTLTYPLSNVVFDSCEYTQIETMAMLQSAEYVNCRRIGMPKPKFNVGTLAWASTTPNTPVLSIAPPAGTKFCWGDTFHVKLSAFIDAGLLAHGDMHIAINAFGGQPTLLNFAAGGASQEVNIDLSVDLLDRSMISPDKFSVMGRVAIDGTPQPLHFFIGVFPNDGSPVEIQAWVDNAASLIIPMMAKISFVPVESRGLAGI